MSPRRNEPRGRRSGDPAAPRDLEKSFGYQRTENDRDGEWVVRSVTGAGSAKTYRCPGCDHEIRPGVPHLVVWPADAGSAAWHGGGLDDRRHWHTPCWNARSRRPRR